MSDPFAQRALSGPDNCEPCEMLGLTNPSIVHTGMDSTPVCGWHYQRGRGHSWSEKPPTVPQVMPVTIGRPDGTMSQTVWAIEYPDATCVGPYDSEAEARADILRICKRGHPQAPDARYCAQCGARL